METEKQNSLETVLSPPPANIRTLSEKIRQQIVSGNNRRANDELMIPKRFRKKSLMDFKGSALPVERAKAALDAGRSLYLYGNTGTGKTHLALGLLLRWFTILGYPHKKYGIFLSVPELFYELKRCYERNEGDSAVLIKYSEVSCLVMDDFGAERISEWSRQVFYLIIDRRYREMKQTIFTSNLTLQQIGTLIDDRIASRIAEMCQVLRLDGPDRRNEQSRQAVGESARS